MTKASEIFYFFIFIYNNTHLYSAKIIYFSQISWFNPKHKSEITYITGVGEANVFEKILTPDISLAKYKNNTSMKKKW